MSASHLKLCVLTNIEAKSISEYKNFILQTVQGGVTSVQLRAKNKSLSEILHLATELKSILKPLKIPLIINDHVEIAKAVDAEGVHVGQSDLSAAKAREILGPEKIIGLSVESLQELEIANQLDCINYIGASAVFASSSKPDCKTIWGIEGLKKISQLSRHPVVAIGGIDQTNIKQIIASGACGAAVISAIHNHSDPRQAAADLITAINNTLQQGAQYV